MTPEQKKDLNRRSAQSIALPKPIKPIPKFSEHLVETSPRHKAAFQKMDAAMEEWRKQLMNTLGAGSGGTGGGGVTVITGGGNTVVTPPGTPGPANSLSIGTVVGGPVASASITGIAPHQILNLVLPRGTAGEDGVDGTGSAPGLLLRSPDDGLFYLWRPRLADDGETVTGEWLPSDAPLLYYRNAFASDDASQHLWVPRLADTLPDGTKVISGEWQVDTSTPLALAGLRCVDNGEYYSWEPRLSDVPGVYSGVWTLL